MALAFFYTPRKHDKTRVAQWFKELESNWKAPDLIPTGRSAAETMDPISSQGAR